MPTRLSTVLGITRKQLEDKGVYDTCVDFDSKLHIDPALLKRCTIPEFALAAQKVSDYFKGIIIILSKSKKASDVFWRAGHRRLTFGEGLYTGLGYSEKGTSGSGIGPETAERIAHTIKEIVEAGITDPAIFDLVPVIEERIGPDRISDMISKILKEEFNNYTDRICSELKVKRYHNPAGESIVFVPKVLLSSLPIVEQWEDVQIAAAYNEEVREVLNSVIGKSWKQAVKEMTKKEFRDFLVKTPALLDELLTRYKSRAGDSYDFKLDHLGALLWDIVGKPAAENFPIDLSEFKKITPENILEIVSIICKQYKKLIENNGLVEHIYDVRGDRRPERFAQLLFFAIADSYCSANNLDLSREINGGSGALDFKISHGLAKVTVEIKYSSNPKLVEGYEKQLPTYNKAEGVGDQFSMYLVLRVNDRQDLKLKKIEGIVKERARLQQLSPLFMVVDAIIRPTASKR